MTSYTGGTIIQNFETTGREKPRRIVIYDTTKHITTSIEGEFGWYVDNAMWTTHPYQRYTMPLVNIQQYYGEPWVACDTVPFPKDPRQTLRDMLRRRSAPPVIVRCPSLPPAPDERELRARDTLRSFIGEDRWRRFVRDGFVTVHSHKDGRTYQIFPNHGITRVYERGTMVERLCCYLRGDFPATDHLLMRFLLILNSPIEFRRMCNVHGVLSPQGAKPIPATVDLVAEFRRLKQQAA